MAISTSSYHYGAALFQLLSKNKAINITNFPTQSNNSFSINNDFIGLHLKYSTKKSSPWTFSFSRQHQEELRIISEMHKHSFLVLIYGSDGITCISYLELKKVLDEYYEETEWIKLSRLPGQSYTLTGTDGVLDHKITSANFPRDILALI